MKELIILNTLANPVSINFISLAGGEAGVFQERHVSKKLIEKGILKELDEMPVGDAPVETETPDAPDADEGNDEEDLTKLDHDAIAVKLADEPDLIPEDATIASGAPTVDALEDAFGQDFSADDRDAIWAKVEELKA